MHQLRPLLLASVALAACTGATDPIAPGPGAPQMTASLTVRDSHGTPGPFRIDLLDKFAVAVQLVAAPPGPLPLRLDILNPAGELYVQLPVTAEVDSAGRATYRQDLEVQGTPIDGLRMSGVWTFRLARIDGVEPLASAQAEVGE